MPAVCVSELRPFASCNLGHLGGFYCFSSVNNTVVSVLAHLCAGQFSKWKFLVKSRDILKAFDGHCKLNLQKCVVLTPTSMEESDFSCHTLTNTILLI